MVCECTGYERDCILQSILGRGKATTLLKSVVLSPNIEAILGRLLFILAHTSSESAAGHWLTYKTSSHLHGLDVSQFRLAVQKCSGIHST